MCGENFQLRVDLALDDGSSPRVRGKPAARQTLARIQGLIPACAGKTSVTLRLLPRSGAHPRVCGENPREAAPIRAEVGSSPRVRGKPTVLERTLSDVGLIPACAGKTSRGVTFNADSPAHPRVCGENFTTHVLPALQSGSSPRVRGKRWTIWSFSAQIGQILENLELSVFFESYSLQGVCATAVQQDQALNTDRVPRNGTAASSK